MNKVYALMTVKNRWEYTKVCIESIKAQSHPQIQTVLVDDGSTDETSNKLKIEFPWVNRIEGNGDLWWTGGMNLGLKYILALPEISDEDYILLLNNDTSFDNDFIHRLVESCIRNKYSPVGSIARSAKTNEVLYVAHLNSGGKTTPSKIDLTNYKEGDLVFETDCLNTKGTIVPVSVFRRVGIFSKYFPHYAADWDFFYRVKKKGYRLAVDPLSVVYSLNDDKNLSERIREKKRIGLSEFLQLFFSRRSSFNLYSTLLHIILHVPLPQKFIGIAKTLFGVPYIFIRKVILGL